MSQKEIGFPRSPGRSKNLVNRVSFLLFYVAEKRVSSPILMPSLPRLDENQRLFAGWEGQLQVLYPIFGHQPFLLFSTAVAPVQPQF